MLWHFFDTTANAAWYCFRSRLSVGASCVCLPLFRALTFENLDFETSFWYADKPSEYPSRSIPSCQISSSCGDPRRIYPLRKNCGQTKKERNKYASYADWSISAHADRLRWPTRRSLVTGQFVTCHTWLATACPMRYQHFSLFGLEGVNPCRAKVHRNER